MNFMAFPKKKWLTSKELKHEVESKPAKASKKDRKNLEDKCLQLWSKLIRIRDGNRCQWCGTTKGVSHAHHIVARSACSTLGTLNLNNGMTLCPKCHIFDLKDHPEAYILMRDSWLRTKGLTYEALEKACTAKVKLTIDDLQEKHKQLSELLTQKTSSKMPDKKGIFLS